MTTETKFPEACVVACIHLFIKLSYLSSKNKSFSNIIIYFLKKSEFGYFWGEEFIGDVQIL